MRKSKRALGSNLLKLDATTDEEIARQIAEDRDTAPELTDEWLDDSELWEGDRFIRRVGRPKGSGKKEMVTLRIDRDVLDQFRATGPGWQTRMNDALREIADTGSHEGEVDADTTAHTQLIDANSGPSSQNNALQGFGVNPQVSGTLYPTNALSLLAYAQDAYQRRLSILFNYAASGYILGTNTNLDPEKIRLQQENTALRQKLLNVQLRLDDKDRQVEALLNSFGKQTPLSVGGRGGVLPGANTMLSYEFQSQGSAVSGLVQ